MIIRVLNFACLSFVDNRDHAFVLHLLIEIFKVCLLGISSLPSVTATLSWKVKFNFFASVFLTLTL